MRTGLHASVIKAKLDLDRAQTLLAQHVMPQSEYDAVKARYDGLVGEEIAAEARVGQADIALADTELRSPLDGVVVQRSIEVGDLAAPGTPAFTVADTRNVKVIFGVPDSVRKAMRLDEAVAIRTEAVEGRTFRGAVSKIAEKADERSRAFDVEATVDNADVALKIGFIATVELENAGALGPVPAVPLSAVVPSPRKDEYAVFVVTSRDGRSVASMRPVVLGDLIRNDVTVISGVVQGDSVIIVGAEQVHDGEQVAVVP
jgi:multidrug efflux system membrane fusion protein